MSKFPIAFGRQLLLERINVGGMAEVFKAKAFGVEGFERIVAVKRILPTLLEDDDFTTMFVDEARIAAQLTHQNIVQIYDLGKAEDTFFISMEYVAGRDLRAILDWQKKQAGPMAVAKACFIVSRVSEALEYAHRKRDPAGRDLKIIHRDVTPQNVILSYEGEVKLCDFGIAKAASRASRTQVGVLKGKFAYMAPEQVRGQPTDRRSDIFALGVLFYEMLTAQRLFLGDSDYATLEAVRNAVIPPPRQFNPEISPELEQVLLRMLAQHPRDRYQWAAEVHEDLLDHLVDGGRPYHGRHLRKWMQEIYAREIEIENAKLESFMQLRLANDDLDDQPKMADAVQAMQEQGVAQDPAETANLDFQGDPTDHFAIPGGPHASEVPSYEGDELTYDDATAHERESLPALRSATRSPVSDLYGAPELDDEPSETSQTGSNNAYVRPADAQAVEEPESDGERTQFDMQVDPALVAPDSDTLFGDGNETVMGDEGGFEADIGAAQSELLNELEAAGALDQPDFRDDFPYDESIPELDSGDLELEDPTLHGDETVNGLLNFGGESGDDTNLNPLVYPEETDEDAFAATAMRAEGLDDSMDDMDGMDSGTIDDAPPPQFDPNVFRSHDIQPQDETPVPRPPPPSPVDQPPEWRRPPSSVQGRNTPRPIIERNHTHRPPEPVASVPAPADPIAAPSRSKSRLLMAVAGGLGLLAVLIVVGLIATNHNRRATLRITCEPPQVDVLLDGAFVGDHTPIELDNLEVGKHRIELRAPGYMLYGQTIEFREPKPHHMSVILEVGDESAAPLDVLGGPDEELPMGDGAPDAEGASANR